MAAITPQRCLAFSKMLMFAPLFFHFFNYITANIKKQYGKCEIIMIKTKNELSKTQKDLTIKMLCIKIKYKTEPFYPYNSIS
jgi:hypothetical protein